MWFGSATEQPHYAIRQSCERGVRRQTTSVSGPRPWSPIGRRAEHASARLQNDTNVLLPPLTIAKGSTATWSWRHRQPRRRICALTTRLLQRSARRAAVYVTIAPLQRVINAAVRLVYGLHPRDHVSAAAIELHWLPIEYRIQYKICLLVHLSLNGKAPSYISSLIQSVFTLSTRPTVLRSASNLDLFLPRSTLKFGERAFRIVTPKVWNTLPLNVRQTSYTQTFTRNLKTFLFCTSYNIPTPTPSLADWTFYVVFYCISLHCILCLFYHLFYSITVIGWSELSCCKPLLSDIRLRVTTSV